MWYIGGVSKERDIKNNLYFNLFMIFFLYNVVKVILIVNIEILLWFFLFNKNRKIKRCYLENF